MLSAPNAVPPLISAPNTLPIIRIGARARRLVGHVAVIQDDGQDQRITVLAKYDAGDYEAQPGRPYTKYSEAWLNALEASTRLPVTIQWEFPADRPIHYGNAATDRIVTLAGRAARLGRDASGAGQRADDEGTER